MDIRERLLSGATLRRTKVEISLGEMVVQEMTGAQREQYFNLCNESEAAIPPNMQAKIVQWCLVDNNGQRIFQPEDIGQISEMSGRDIEAIVYAALAVSGLTDSAVEELKGNSTGDLSDELGSESPKCSDAA